MKKPWVKDGDYTMANIVLCAVLALIEGLQVIIAVALVFSFIPIPMDPFYAHLFPRHKYLVLPEREMFFYHVWLGLVIVFQATLLGIFRKQLKEQQLWKRLWPFCAVEAGWLLLMIFAVFKIFVYGFPAWKYFLYAVLAGAFISKFFWMELNRAVTAWYKNWDRHAVLVQRSIDIIMPLVIAGIIFTPDFEGVIGRIFMGDCLHHEDSTLMGQAWAYLNGAILNVDVYVHYGIGFPIIIANATKLLGGLSYEHVLAVLMSWTILYYILCYFFLRIWLKNIWAAVAGILLAIKWQMFHLITYPFIFAYPYATVVRYGFDIIVLLLILAHIRRGKFHFLLAAGAVCGLAVFNVSDMGVYLIVAYIFYLTWLAVEEIVHQREAWQEVIFRKGLCMASMLGTAFILFYAFQGAHLWSKQFWLNMSERAQLFLIGHGDIPMYQSLVDGDYLESLMSFVVPLVYGMVLIVVVSLCFLRKIPREHIIVAVLCVYGLGLYHYYVVRSGGTSYYTMCIPYVFVLCFLVHEGSQFLNARAARAVWISVVLTVTFALLTNHHFLSYPNIFNFSRNPIVAPAIKPVVKEFGEYFTNISRRVPEQWKLSVNSLGETDEDLKVETDFKTDAEFREYFKKEFDFHEDAELIDDLTTPGTKVPLFSSFETRILMQANRGPFFYYFPIIDSRPMHMRTFSYTSLWTTDRLALTINQLDRARPEYVFMERILLARQVPQIYESFYPEMIIILQYLDRYYRPYKYGKFLVALKRI